MERQELEQLLKDTFNSEIPVMVKKQIDKLSRKITKEEYEEVEQYMYQLPLENGYIQELGEHEEEYVPNFDLTGVEKNSKEEC